MRRILTFLKSWFWPETVLEPICGRCGKPRSAACGDDFITQDDPRVVPLNR